MSQVETNASVWYQTSAGWNHILPPMRLVEEEIAFFQEALAQAKASPLRAVILGVTQELYRMPWPTGTELVAVDHMQPMIDRVWLGPPEDAFCAEWQQLPFPDESKDLAFCDGGLTLNEYPSAVQGIATELKRVLMPGGIAAFRLYAPPIVRENPKAVLEDLLEGRISNLSELKMRMWTALGGGPEEGTRIAEVYEAIDQAIPDREALAARIGWPLEHLNAINAYRDSPDIYRFPSAAQVTAIFEEAGFDTLWVRMPTFALGERCPTLAFKKTL